MIRFSDENVTLHHGDSIEVLAEIPEASVDAVVTDPPYELGFMGKAWDASGIAYSVDLWREVLRVVKPGGHLLAFGGTRTWHRMVCAIEDAGFEIRDELAWLYGQGFPKSLDVSKAIDRARGEDLVPAATVARWLVDQMEARGIGRREVATPGDVDRQTIGGSRAVEVDITAPATPDAERWQGWGTALKPAHEPICLARKPLRGTVAGNVLEHGTGALNIDGCRIDMGAGYDPAKVQRQSATTAGMSGLGESGFAADHQQATYNASGRWPANVVLDDEAARLLDQQSGHLHAAANRPESIRKRGTAPVADQASQVPTYEGGPSVAFTDSGGASRFFYVAKAAKHERPRVDGKAHATVKPVELMRWLVRLVTPPGGLVLDLFAGSGTTAEACIVEGFRCVLIEKDADHLPLIEARLSKPIAPTLFGGAS